MAAFSHIVSKSMEKSRHPGESSRWSCSSSFPRSMPGRSILLIKRKVGIPYRSVAKGYFEKRKNGSPMRGDLVTTYKDPMNDVIYDSLLSIHEETGISMTALSLLYFIKQPFPSVAIASFTSNTQLHEGLSILSTDHDSEILSRVASLRCDLH